MPSAVEPELEHCENCGLPARFKPVFGPALATERCERCQGWSHRGSLSRSGEELYDREYFFGGEYRDYAASGAAQRRNFERKLRILRDAGCAIGPGARVLEVGCATGEFLSLLGEIPGVECLGIEVSPYARREGVARGLSVLAPDDPELAARLRELRPSFIVAWDVWEHLAHPATVFDGYLASAGPGCVVALTTVDASSAVARLRGSSWRQFHPPTHLNYPTRDSFRLFFAKHSHAIVYHRAFGYHRPLLEYAAALGVHSIPERVRPIPVYLNLHDTQLVVARSRA